MNQKIDSKLHAWRWYWKLSEGSNGGWSNGDCLVMVTDHLEKLIMTIEIVMLHQTEE